MDRLSQPPMFWTAAFAGAAALAATAVLFATGKWPSRPPSELRSPRIATRYVIVPEPAPPAVEPDIARPPPANASTAESDAGTLIAVIEIEPASVEAPDISSAPETTEVPETAAAAEEAAEAPQQEPAPALPIACGPATCPSDYECCNASCGICVRPGERCSQRPCDMPMTPFSQSCGPITCNIGELCCDPACGKCVKPGEACAPGSCLSPIEYPFSESCGMTTCNTGTVCCNPSCGICAPPGVPCSKRVCS